MADCDAPPRELTEKEEAELKQRRIEAKQRKALAKQKKNAELNLAMADRFKRTQRYLGLRPTTPGAPPAVDPVQPVPFAFDQSVVFVSVDIESYERAHHKVTEIGIATLDTRDLANLAPGIDGENWRAKINARHFRVKEHGHLVNYEFVKGCPDRFEFGTSEFISLADAAAYTGGCFKPPFCGPDLIDLGERRNIVFIGHDFQNDIEYMKTVGFDMHKETPDLLECVDTAHLYRTWTRQPNQSALGKVLLDFDIVGWHLHNAGNDAVYTVQAMLAVCVRESSLRNGALLVVAAPPAPATAPEDSDREI